MKNSAAVRAGNRFDINTENQAQTTKTSDAEGAVKNEVHGDRTN